MVDSPPNRDTGHIFVGREREMAELTFALDDALAGEGRLVMLAGEPASARFAPPKSWRPTPKRKAQWSSGAGATRTKAGATSSG